MNECTITSEIAMALQRNVYLLLILEIFIFSLVCFILLPRTVSSYSTTFSSTMSHVNSVSLPNLLTQISTTISRNKVSVNKMPEIEQSFENEALSSNSKTDNLYYSQTGQSKGIPGHHALLPPTICKSNLKLDQKNSSHDESTNQLRPYNSLHGNRSHVAEKRILLGSNTLLEIPDIRTREKGKLRTIRSNVTTLVNSNTRNYKLGRNTPLRNIRKPMSILGLKQGSPTSTTITPVENMPLLDTTKLHTSPINETGDYTSGVQSPELRMRSGFVNNQQENSLRSWFWQKNPDISTSAPLFQTTVNLPINGIPSWAPDERRNLSATNKTLASIRALSSKNASSEVFDHCDDECEKKGGVCVIGNDFRPHCIAVADDACKHFRCDNGECISDEGVYRCECNENWTGTFCDTPCTLDCGQYGYCARVDDDTDHHGTGRNVIATARVACICHWNRTGAACEEIREIIPLVYEINKPSRDTSAWQVALVVVVSAVLLILVSTLASYNLWRRRWLPMRKLVFFFQEYEDDDDKDYDAFVSFKSCAKDEQFVLQQLYPKLEIELGFRLCMHFRDFLPGEPIANNIIHAIEHSRRTILVLSENYVASEWCRMEYQKAQLEMLKLRHKIIPVMLEDVSGLAGVDKTLKTIIDTVTYIKWPQDRIDSATPCSHDSVASSVQGDHLKEKFWKVLMCSMPKKRRCNGLTVSSHGTACYSMAICGDMTTANLRSTEVYDTRLICSVAESTRTDSSPEDRCLNSESKKFLATRRTVSTPSDINYPNGHYLDATVSCFHNHRFSGDSFNNMDTLVTTQISESNERSSNSEGNCALSNSLPLERGSLSIYTQMYPIVKSFLGSSPISGMSNTHPDTPTCRVTRINNNEPKRSHNLYHENQINVGLHQLKPETLKSDREREQDLPTNAYNAKGDGVSKATTEDSGICCYMGDDFTQLSMIANSSDLDSGPMKTFDNSYQLPRREQNILNAPNARQDCSETSIRLNVTNNSHRVTECINNNTPSKNATSVFDNLGQSQKRRYIYSDDHIVEIKYNNDQIIINPRPETGRGKAYCKD